jgi:DNA-binding GntR family transcriptional regulator
MRVEDIERMSKRHLKDRINQKLAQAQAHVSVANATADLAELHQRESKRPAFRCRANR